MQVEIGKIYEGTVKNITNYGTFVDIHNPDGERIMGMVHISEISRSYVSEIRDFVTEGQQVKVKVIGINPQGKISLSMKQAEEAPAGGDRPSSAAIIGDTVPAAAVPVRRADSAVAESPASGSRRSGRHRRR